VEKKRGGGRDSGEKFSPRSKQKGEERPIARKKKKDALFFEAKKRNDNSAHYAEGPREGEKMSALSGRTIRPWGRKRKRGEYERDSS